MLDKKNDMVKSYEWCSLIEYSIKHKFVENGLTIPFLIGAIAIIRNRMLTISEFTDELTDKNNSKRPTIMQCANIRQLIIGIAEFETISYINKSPLSEIKSFGNLIVTDASLNHLNSVENLKPHFEKLYIEKLNEGAFSLNEGKFDSFTKDDLNHIDAFKKYASRS